MHDFNPGFSPTGVFWTLPVAPDSAQGEVDNAAIGLRVTDAAVGDYHDVANAIRQGRSVPATLSYDLRWSGATAVYDLRNAEQRFAVRGAEATATMTWRAETDEFKFASSPSRSVFAVVGNERNGVFFS